MTRKALWQQLDTYPAQWDRQTFGALVPTAGRVTGMAVTVTTGRIVNVAAGSFIVSYGGTLGSALCVSDAVETVQFPSPPAAGTSRIDLLLCQVRDSAVDAGTANGFDFTVVSGAASSTPSPPAVPARAGIVASLNAVGGQANIAQGDLSPGASAHTFDWFAPYVPPALPDYAIVQLYGGPGVGNASNPAPGGMIGVRGAITYDGNAVHIARTGIYLVNFNYTINNTAHVGQAGYWQLDYFVNGAVPASLTGMFTGGLYAPYPSISAQILIGLNSGDAIAPATFGSGMTAAASVNGGRFEVIQLS